MIHLSNPAAYHDKRFKNNPTKRKTMKTPLPEPAYTDSMLHEPTAYTEAQMKAAMVAAYNERVEDNTRLRVLLKEARKIIRASSSRSITKDWDERATDALKETP